jgi:hypothetical protein
MNGSFHAPMTRGHAERVAAHAHMARLHHDRRGLVPRLRPLVQVRERELGLMDVDVDVHQIGVGLVAAKVVPQRLPNRIAALLHHRLDRLQLLDPPRHWARVPRLEYARWAATRSA